MATDPLTLPPGPERRKLMRELSLNIGPADFTPEEWAAHQAETEKDRKAFAEMRSSK